MLLFINYKTGDSLEKRKRNHETISEFSLVYYNDDIRVSAVSNIDFEYSCKFLWPNKTFSQAIIVDKLSWIYAQILHVLCFYQLLLHLGRAIKLYIIKKKAPPTIPSPVRFSHQLSLTQTQPLKASLWWL